MGHSDDQHTDEEVRPVESDTTNAGPSHLTEDIANVRVPSMGMLTMLVGDTVPFRCEFTHRL